MTRAQIPGGSTEGGRWGLHVRRHSADTEGVTSATGETGTTEKTAERSAERRASTDAAAPATVAVPPDAAFENVPLGSMAAGETDLPATPTTEAGQSIVDEALALLDQRKWKQALTVAASAKRLRPNDIVVDVIMATAAAYCRTDDGDHVARLRDRSEFGDMPDEQSARAWLGLASVALANGHYSAADEAARRSIELDGDNPDAWWHLAASYAGLGWFDEADQCIEAADRLGDARLLSEWQVGRAANDWSMDRAPTAIITIIAVLFLGLLGIAVGITTPFLTREVRVSRLDDRMKTLAALAWRDRTIFRLANAVAVLVVVIAWITFLSLNPGGT